MKILVVDDEPDVVESVRLGFTLQWRDVDVLGASEGQAALDLVEREHPDIVLLDIGLPGIDGYEVLRQIRAFSDVPVVMLTAVQDDETVLESIQAGADGYLTKDRAVDDVVATVRSARAGETLLPRSVIIGIAQRVAAARDRQPERPPIEPLTARELQVLQALAEGMATPGICETLFISRNTLRTHVQNIMMKLHVHSKLEAVTVGLRNRIIEPPRPDDSLY